MFVVVAKSNFKFLYNGFVTSYVITTFNYHANYPYPHTIDYSMYPTISGYSVASVEIKLDENDRKEKLGLSRKLVQGDERSR